MKSWLCNCLEVIETKEGMLPLRFTNAQVAFMRPRPHLFRCYNAAGIGVDIHTDSPYIRLRYRAKLKPGTTERLCFDIFVDDMLIGYEEGTFTEEGGGEWTAKLPIRTGQPRRVTIYQ